jgi:hypothetical protein
MTAILSQRGETTYRTPRPGRCRLGASSGLMPGAEGSDHVRARSHPGRDTPDNTLRRAVSIEP